MIDGKRVLAFIPARGGSKGIPHKNIQDLAGTPLIGHTIKAALNCPYVDACMVSTDDDEIARVAHEQGGWVPFLRPIELATDTSKTIDCLDHAVKKLAADGTPFDIVCLLQATSPFRTAEDLTGAIRFSAPMDIVASPRFPRSPTPPSSCALISRPVTTPQGLSPSSQWALTMRTMSSYPQFHEPAPFAVKICQRSYASTAPFTSISLAISTHC